MKRLCSTAQAYQARSTLNVLWLRVAWLLCLYGCERAVLLEDSADALMQVRGGTFFRAAFPQAQEGPSVSGVYLGRTRLRPGETGKNVQGTLADTSVAVALALGGDVGYWVLAAGSPAPDTPRDPTFASELSFSRRVPTGKAQLWVAAVNEAGTYGKRSETSIEFTDTSLVNSRLRVELRWDGESDLDLVVKQPDGSVLSKDNASFGSSTQGAKLSADSRPECIQDSEGESADWQGAPLAGHYSVYVRTFALCGAELAYWSLAVIQPSQPALLVEGRATQGDGPQNGRELGVLAAEFDVE